MEVFIACFIVMCLSMGNDHLVWIRDPHLLSHSKAERLRSSVGKNFTILERQSRQLAAAAANRTEDEPRPETLATEEAGVGRQDGEEGRSGTAGEGAAATCPDAAAAWGPSRGPPGGGALPSSVGEGVAEGPRQRELFEAQERLKTLSETYTVEVANLKAKIAFQVGNIYPHSSRGRTLIFS